MLVKRVEEFKEVVPQEPGVKGVKMRVLSPDEGSFVMRVFEVEPGGNTPSHSHPWEHQVYVLSGRGRVFIGDESFDVEEGFFVYVPPNVPHQFVNAGEDVFRFICAIPKVS